MHQSDQQPLEDAYELVMEGLWDRMKARGSRAKAAVQGVGGHITWKAKQVAGGFLNRAATGVGHLVGADTSKSSLAKYGKEMEKTGNVQREKSSRMAEEAKYKSYITSAAQTIAKDLGSLGIPVKDENQLVVDLKQAIIKNLTQVTANGQFRTGAGKIGSKVI